MRFRPLPDDVPIIGLTESGNDMMLTVAFVGVVEYDRKDSESLAQLLEQATATVREHA